jgi:hypothetical protein
MNSNDLKNKSFPSMCIPRVNSNINENYIRQVINKLNIGIIKHIDIIKKKKIKKDDKMYNCVFIHFSKWNNTLNGEKVRNLLINGSTIKIIYNDNEPWFWKIYASRDSLPNNIYLNKYNQDNQDNQDN